MAGGVELVTNAWKEWSLQALVLLSLTLQVTLLILAEFRRHIDSGVLRAFVWSAYMLADTTAIYVLGHLSVLASRSPEHELMALWGPFLLVHLGGQDNITAYALEDRKLWLRHLQTLVVQVATAAYVVYVFSVVVAGDSRSLLLPATILVSLVGVVKYGERVWALRFDGCKPTEGYDDINYDGPPGKSQKFLDSPAFTDRSDAEAFLLKAHLLMDFAKGFFKWGPLSDLPVRMTPASALDTRPQQEEVFKVVEMQLSLIHDLFYTKAEVTHTWYGLCLRLLSSLAIGVAFLLFNILLLFDGHCRKLKGGYSYSRVDLVVTYVLFVGAVILETTSLLRAMFSSWTFALLVQWCTDMYSGLGDEITNAQRLGIAVRTFLARVLVSLRRLVRAADRRRRRSWSRSMGQQNLIRLCTRSRASRSSRVARWMGVEDRWNTWAYSWSVPVSECVKRQLLKSIEQLQEDSVAEISGHIDAGEYNKGADLEARQWGRSALKRRRLHKRLAWSVELKMEESILVWHIATDVYLRRRRKADEEEQAAELAEAARALSNYMLFLLAAQPEMLPPSASRDPYVYTCYDILQLAGLDCSSDEEVLCLLGRYAEDNQPEVPCDVNKTLRQGCRLGAFLIGLEQQGSPGAAGDTLEMICQVWADMLCYAGHGCGAQSHAKQLSRGGELLTVAALVAKYAASQKLDNDYND
ncbi:uncharacterized protein LOC120640518 [Panicum virgatum]|uniref:DUF4220 domain-containing protein n=1 Tax=Panicum virgatum TaxID=38727 RepID=A0A8T0QB79_PANVG|nr:uncharacterized protein LOC120640518 [Panicum virgatum]KAG2571169.1 hypothetical protein PVAP13_7KG005089 [Panicum virgatum]KAG2571170.1 hypothetical protein PVAP13_7KG005089 [Panicum virgatum]